MKVLSSGERRALYILNIIFEVEARKAQKQATLFIVDDIADSFDYKNKYAIIEYLMEVAAEDGFQQIVLSHNFDFYRSVSGRLHLGRRNRILASKEDSEIHLEEEVYQNSAPFSDWRMHLDNERKLIASIPFIRNLAEFSGDDDSYMKLTSLLHVKSDTDQFDISDLQGLIQTVLHDQANLVLANQGRPVKDLIFSVADAIVGDPADSALLEEKVVLSIAIRLKSEEYMIGRINDNQFWQGIARNQTVQLIQRFKEDFPTEADILSLLNRVNLMTPENIHLNSFMYEPILDLSAQHLKRLYRQVSTL